MLEAPYYIHYSPMRLRIHKLVTSKYFDLMISAVIGLNVITMAMEFYMMPKVGPLAASQTFFGPVRLQLLSCPSRFWSRP